MTASARSPHPLYVALGDSTGVGVGAAAGGGYPERLARRLAAQGHPVRLENLCVSGARVSDVLAGQVSWLPRATPALLTLAIGINDATHGTSPAEFARDYERVAEPLAGTGAPVVLVNLPDLSRSPLGVGDELRRAVRERLAALNGVIDATARRHGFELVDLFAATGDELATRPELLSADRFHPSASGYERWADAMLPGVGRALERARAGDRGGAPGR